MYSMGFQKNAKIVWTSTIVILISWIIAECECTPGDGAETEGSEARARGDTAWLWSSSSSASNYYSSNPYYPASSASSNYYSNSGYNDLGPGFGGGAAGPVYICGWLGSYEGVNALVNGYGPPDIKEVAFIAYQRIMSRMPYWNYGMNYY